MSSKNVIAARVKRHGWLVIAGALWANGANVKIELSFRSNYAQAAPESAAAPAPTVPVPVPILDSCPVHRDDVRLDQSDAIRKCGCAALRMSEVSRK